MTPRADRGRTRLLAGVARAATTLSLCLAAALFASPAAAESDPADDPRPLNILLVIADDLGWADIGANTPDCFYDTPAIDALARSGVNFTRGYAASPVCSPTRVSIMSGVNPTPDAATEWFWTEPARSERYLSADRINKLPIHRATIAERLRAAGYQTFFAGKWHLGGDARHLPQSRGFDVNIAGSERGSPAGNGGYFAPYPDAMRLDAPEGEHLPARLTDETIRWIGARDEGRPFLAVLSYYSVHTPLQGRQDLVEKYRARAEKLAIADADRFADEEQVWDRDAPRRVRVAQDHAVYAAMVEAMDEQVGRLLDALDKQGLRDDTLVVFVSDNGGLSTAEGSPTANLPLRGGKGWLYEGGLRVPYILRWPGVSQPGRATDTPVHTSDIAPTILDAARLAPADDPYPRDAMEGTSLRETIADLAHGISGAGRPLYFHYPHYSNQGGFPGAAMIRGDAKLILRYEDGRAHLYDLAEDPGERRDLAPSIPAAADSMRADLLEWLGRNNARFLGRRGEGPFPWHPSRD